MKAFLQCGMLSGTMEILEPLPSVYIPLMQRPYYTDVYQEIEYHPEVIKKMRFDLHEVVDVGDTPVAFYRFN